MRWFWASSDAIGAVLEFFLEPSGGGNHHVQLLVLARLNHFYPHFRCQNVRTTEGPLNEWGETRNRRASIRDHGERGESYEFGRRESAYLREFLDTRPFGVEEPDWPETASFARRLPWGFPFGSCSSQSFLDRNYARTRQARGLISRMAGIPFARRAAGPSSKTSMRFRPCFRAVDSTLRRVAKSRAPCANRNPPEIFIRNVCHGSWRTTGR